MKTFKQFIQEEELTFDVAKYDNPSQPGTIVDSNITKEMFDKKYGHFQKKADQTLLGYYYNDGEVASYVTVASVHKVGDKTE